MLDGLWSVTRGSIYSENSDFENRKCRCYVHWLNKLIEVGKFIHD